MVRARASFSAEDECAARDLLDMDGAIKRYCAAAEIVEPTDIEARKELHLAILYGQLGNRQGNHHEQM